MLSSLYQLKSKTKLKNQSQKQLCMFGYLLTSFRFIFSPLICCFPVVQSCPNLCYSMDHSTPGFPVLHYLPEFSQTYVHCVSDASNHLILCHPLLHLLSIFPSIRILSNESALWYWSFNFIISLSNEYSGLISF